MRQWDREFGDERACDVAIRAGGADESDYQLRHGFIDDLVDEFHDRCAGE